MTWLRRSNLLLVSESGKGLDLSEFHVNFNIKKADYSTPNSAEITVFNLSEQTIAQLQKEFDSVILQAGYSDNFGLIFKGQVYQYIKGKENGTDTVLKIIAADGDQGYNFANVNTTIAKGSNNEDVLNSLVDSLANQKVEKGTVDKLPTKQTIRGKVMFGMTRDYLNYLTVSTNTSWSIQNGELQVLNNKGYLPDEAVVLNSSSGLIGKAEQTIEGIKVRCLLNPKLKVGGRLKIEESSINLYKAAVDFKNSYKSEIATKINNDGLYRILGIDYIGDTRGQSWYCDIVCVGIDDSAPVNSKIIDKRW